VQGLRSASLASELDRAREALEAAGIEPVVSASGPLPAGVETLLGFAAREGVTNVIRHSRATRCEIAVRRFGEDAELDMRDDGLGTTHAGGQGSGLRGLAERMAEAGGTLDTGPTEGGGFRLIARVPIAGSTPSRPGGESESLTTAP
ncbi:MAG: sensor histidine kinase, partial [Thermoleophilaceae bacterium]